MGWGGGRGSGIWRRGKVLGWSEQTGEVLRRAN